MRRPSLNRRPGDDDPIADLDGAGGDGFLQAGMLVGRYRFFHEDRVGLSPASHEKRQMRLLLLIVLYWRMGLLEETSTE